MPLGALRCLQHLLIWSRPRAFPHGASCAAFIPGCWDLSGATRSQPLIRPSPVASSFSYLTSLCLEKSFSEGPRETQSEYTSFRLVLRSTLLQSTTSFLACFSCCFSQETSSFGHLSLVELHEGTAICLLRLMYSKYPEQSPAHSRCSINNH